MGFLNAIANPRFECSLEILATDRYNVSIYLGIKVYYTIARIVIIIMLLKFYFVIIVFIYLLRDKF